MFVTIGYILSEPIAMLAGFNLFNNWNLVTIAWFSVVWGLSIYSIFLVVGSVFI